MFLRYVSSPENGDNVSPEVWLIPASLHGIKTQNITILIAVNTSNNFLFL
jgi:hypothetical protein